MKPSFHIKHLVCISLGMMPLCGELLGQISEQEKNVLVKHIDQQILNNQNGMRNPVWDAELRKYRAQVINSPTGVGKVGAKPNGVLRQAQHDAYQFAAAQAALQQYAAMQRQMDENARRTREEAKRKIEQDTRNIRNQSSISEANIANAAKAGFKNLDVIDRAEAGQRQPTVHTYKGGAMQLLEDLGTEKYKESKWEVVKSIENTPLYQETGGSDNVLKNVLDGPPSMMPGKPGTFHPGAATSDLPNSFNAPLDGQPVTYQKGTPGPPSEGDNSANARSIIELETKISRIQQMIALNDRNRQAMNAPQIANAGNYGIAAGLLMQVDGIIDATLASNHAYAKAKEAGDIIGEAVVDLSEEGSIDAGIILDFAGLKYDRDEIHVLQALNKLGKGGNIIDIAATAADVPGVGKAAQGVAAMVAGQQLNDKVQQMKSQFDAQSIKLKNRLAREEKNLRKLKQQDAAEKAVKPSLEAPSRP